MSDNLDKDKKSADKISFESINADDDIVDSVLREVALSQQTQDEKAKTPPISLESAEHNSEDSQEIQVEDSKSEVLKQEDSGDKHSESKEDIVVLSEARVAPFETPEEDEYPENLETADSAEETEMQKKKNRLRKGIIIGTVSVLVAVMLGAGFYFFSDYMKYQKMMEDVIGVPTFYEGIYINDISLGGLTYEQASERIKQNEPNLRPAIDIVITCAGEDYHLTQDNLTFSYDTEQVLKDAYNSGREGSRQARYDYVQHVKTQPDKFSVTCTLDPHNCSLDKFIPELSSEVHKDPVPPHISSFNPDSESMFTYDNGSQGRDLLAEELTSSLISTLSNKSYSANIPANTTPIPIPDTSDKPSLEEQSALLSTFSTVSTNNADANSNMALALASVNGKTINPGESFSFNRSTGDTTTGAKGYKPAAAIVDGEYVDQYGGGICQASTTVYGAALRADMQITVRSCHMWPSSYVPIGQDAMVSYGSSDFQFKNDSSYPVFIKSGMSGSALTVKIYGYHPSSWDKIEVVSEGNSDSTYASGNKLFYKNGSVVKTEAILPSTYKPK